MSKQRKPQRTLSELKRIWYAKLAKSGFEDIEVPDSKNELLKRWHAADFAKRAQTPATFFAKQEYFIKATEFLNWYKFASKKELKIWTLHANGATLREIAKATKLKKDKVHRIIKRLLKESLCAN